jgi:hypothetical protein
MDFRALKSISFAGHVCLFLFGRRCGTACRLQYQP